MCNDRLHLRQLRRFSKFRIRAVSLAAILLAAIEKRRKVARKRKLTASEGTGEGVGVEEICTRNKVREVALNKRNGFPVLRWLRAESVAAQDERVIHSWLKELSRDGARPLPSSSSPIHREESSLLYTQRESVQNFQFAKWLGNNRTHGISRRACAGRKQRGRRIIYIGGPFTREGTVSTGRHNVRAKQMDK